MKCLDKNKLSAFLDGELESKERVLISRHLEECPFCRKRADEYGMVWETLDSLACLEPDPFFASQVSGNALARRKTERLERIFVPVVTSAAAVLSLFLGSFLGMAIYAEISGNSKTVASEYPGQTISSSYGVYPDAQTMEFYNSLGGSY